MDDKRFFLERLINECPDNQILVFVRTKVRAERVLKALERADIYSETLHGDKEQSERTKTLDRFKMKAFKILIATDVSARGIDIPNVDYVVNYDLPELPENYVHRVGRTGRGRNKGQAYAFCSPEEQTMLNDIEAYIGSKIEVLDVPKDLYIDTITSTADASQNDWKTLLKEDDLMQEKRSKKSVKR